MNRIIRGVIESISDEAAPKIGALIDPWYIEFGNISISCEKFGPMDHRVTIRYIDKNMIAFQSIPADHEDVAIHIWNCVVVGFRLMGVTQTVLAALGENK